MQKTVFLVVQFFTSLSHDINYSYFKMKNRLYLVLCLSIFSLQIVAAQAYSEYGIVLRFSLKNGLFPHPKRAEGHTYQDKKFPYAPHYQDSSVLVFIPKDYKFSSKTDILVYFHGWYNHLDSVLAQFKLIEQFAAAHPNALLVLPQGPKDAPDSFGGKLEEVDGFKKFITEVLDSVGQAKSVKNLSPRHIILSGHSGAYRVISFILLHGGMEKQVKEVWLFDGLYGQLEKYGVWLQQKNARFVNFYTKEGGTFATSVDFVTDLKGWHLKFWQGQEKDLTNEMLRNHQIFNIFTPLEHNEVLAKTEMFKRLVKASPFF
jgi:hypothetical protein